MCYTHLIVRSPTETVELLILRPKTRRESSNLWHPDPVLQNLVFVASQNLVAAAVQRQTFPHLLGHWLAELIPSRACARPSPLLARLG